jgi:hypothetical protein
MNFRNKVKRLFEDIESIVGEPITFPYSYILLEDRPKTTHDIDSSAIVQAGYSRNKKELYLRFHSKPEVLYIYSNVSRWLKDKFKFSGSKGQFFQAYIRDRKPFKKILGA